MIALAPRSGWVSSIAFFWGAVCLLPIAFTYTAFGLLGLVLVIDRRSWRQRGWRLRSAANWSPILMFVAWILLVLILGAYYPQTIGNSLHALRIVLTMIMVSMLNLDEVWAALRGFVFGLLVCMIIIGIAQVIKLPDLVLWKGLLNYDGNKSLSNSMLMALTAGCLVIIYPVLQRRLRLAAILMFFALLWVLVFVLPSRTAWLILIFGILLAPLHQPRSSRRCQMLLIGAVMLVLALITLTVPSVRNSLVQGASELVSASSGEAVNMDSSWGIRYRMYRETAQMVRERPLIGWGMGSWNEQWRQRGPEALENVNMPHNDFLWMGAQAGVPGALLLLLLIAAGLPSAWRRSTIGGTVQIYAIVAMLVAVSLNSALRDGAIGLSLWFVVLMIQRAAADTPPHQQSQLFSLQSNDLAEGSQRNPAT